MKKTRAQDALTAERIRAVLADPGVKQSIKDSIARRIGEFYSVTGADTLPDCPELLALEFVQAAACHNYDEKRGQGREKARAARARLAAAIERHEPEEYRIARRAREIFASVSDKQGTTRGGRLIIAAADDVTASGGECVMLSSPLSEFFVEFFVRAVRDVGRGYHSYRELKEIVARVDAGEDVDAIAEEGDRRK